MEKGFSYIWEQTSFDPITNFVNCAIHFTFPKHSQREDIMNAFNYEFRLWSLPEVRDVSLGAHFHDVIIFWEQDSHEDKDISKFEHATSAKHEGTWIAYVVAYRS
jgi:hypothetical protein